MTVQPEEAHGLQVHSLPQIDAAPRGPVIAVAFSTAPDNQLLLATGSNDGTVRIWDPTTGTPIGDPLTGHTSSVLSVAFGTTPEGRLLLATGSNDGTVRIWDPTTGTPIGDPLTGHTSSVLSVAFGTTPEGRLLLATGSNDGTVRIWDPTTGTPIGDPLTGHTSSVLSVAFGTTPEGRLLLATASNDGTVRIWDPTDGKPLSKPLTGHTDWVRSVAFGTTPEGRLLLATASNDGTVRIWDPTDGKPLSKPLTGHTDWVRSVAFGTTPEGRLLLATASNDGTVRIWDPTDGKPLSKSLTGHTDWVRSVAFGTTPEGRLLLATASIDGTVRIWDPTDGKPLSKPLTGHTDWVRSVAFGTTPEGQLLLATASNDRTVQIWDPTTGTHLHTLTGHTDAMRSVAFGTTPEGQLLLATGSNDRTVRIWDPTTGTPIGDPLTGHTRWVNSVAFGTTPEGRLLLATGSDDRTVQIWDPTTGTPIGDPLTGHTSSVLSVAFGTTPEGQLLLATGSDDRTVQIWDPTTGTHQHTLTGHTSWVNSVAFDTTPEGRLLLATGSIDGTVRIWDPTTGTHLHTLTGHTSWVRSVAFDTTPEGQLLLATGSDDRTVQIWDPTTGTHLHTLTGHTDAMRSVAFSTTPDNQLLLAAGSGVVRVWAIMMGREPSEEAPEETPPPISREMRPLRREAIASRDDELTEDLLGREILAGHLAGVLNQLVDKRGGDDQMRGTVVVNIDGRWGAGKSVLARLTTERLARRSENSDVTATAETQEQHERQAKPLLLKDPIVVWFNAWQQSAIGPRWWTLSAEVKKCVEQERAGAARVLLQTVSVAERLLRSKALLLAGAVIVTVAALTLLSTSFADSWDAVSKVVGGIAAVAVVGVGLGRVLFWASPTIGKLHLTADASPLSEVSDIMARLRRWAPRQGQPHRLADTALAVWILLVSGWMLHWTLQEPGAVVRLPDIPLIETLASLPWAALWVPMGAGLVILIVALSAMPRKQPRTATEPKPWAKLSRSAWKRWGLTVASIVLGATTSVLLVFAPSLNAWTLLVGAVLIVIGVGVYLLWLGRGRDTARRPIVLVIDDLDRCSATDTVEYLETIHTLMRAGKRPRFFARWRAPAPFVVLVLADGRWVRTAFERHYADFATLGDQTRQLGADFLQKLFDHTVLVPELTAAQTQEFVDLITESPDRSAGSMPEPHAPDPSGREMPRSPELRVTDSPDARISGPSALGHEAQKPEETHQPRGSDPEPAQAAPEGPEDSLPQSSGPHAPAGDPDADSGAERRRQAEVEADAAQADASEETAQERTRHLLAEYAHILPANPRLIRRVVNAWGMLYWLNRHVTHSEPEDIMVRAAVFTVRFPTMTDELLGSAPPITVAEILDHDDTGPWAHPEVLAVLRDKDGDLIEPARLGRCFGRQYRDTPAELSRRRMPPRRKPVRPRTRIRRRR